MATTVLSIRLTDDVLKALKGAAKADDRKVASMAAILVERGLGKKK